jgi:hypothetical protein
MKRSSTKALFFLTAILSASAFAANSAQPGTLNYIEGHATIGDQQLNAKSVGSVTLEAGQSLSTTDGRAEILLTPGVFLRLDNNSTVKMVTPNLTKTQLELEKGRATVEVNDLRKQNNIQILEGGAATRLVKPGLYEFDANKNQVLVFDGKARVDEAGKDADLKGGRELAINHGDWTTPDKFKKKSDEDDFYKWSSLRSGYLAEANMNAGGLYSPGFYGWGWNPFYSSYTFMPGYGMFYSPFGWGFYPPIYGGYGFYPGGYRSFGRWTPGAYAMHAAPAIHASAMQGGAMHAAGGGGGRR